MRDFYRTLHWRAALASFLLVGGASMARSAEPAATPKASARSTPADDAASPAAEESLPAPPAAKRSLAESLFGDSTDSSADDERVRREFLDPDAAKFGAWQSPVEGGLWPDHADDDIRPIDWLRKWGFRHSSTEGRYVDRSVPLEHSSWLNRPYHVDWFVGPLLGDELAENANGVVEQQSTLLAGFRVGWDYDYFWGVEWRFGWANPDLNSTQFDGVQPGDYFLSDVDLLYYPWGDTKVRPFFQVGMGMARVETVLDDGSRQQTTMLTAPFGAGLQFHLAHWAALRLEVLDNVAFGGDEVDTLNNFSFTAGLEMRLGARPNSYWPWRTSRNVW